MIILFFYSKKISRLSSAFSFQWTLNLDQTGDHFTHAGFSYSWASCLVV